MARQLCCSVIGKKSVRCDGQEILNKLFTKLEFASKNSKWNGPRVTFYNDVTEVDKVIKGHSRIHYHILLITMTEWMWDIVMG